MNLHLSLDSTGKIGEDFVTDFQDPIRFKEEHEVTLLALYYTYSLRNIDTVYSNNTFRYSHNSGTDWNDVTIPGGIYDVIDVRDYFRTVMKAAGHYTAGADPDSDVYYLNFFLNTNTLRVNLEASNNYQFDFTTSDFILIFGGLKQIVTTDTTCPNAPDLNRGVTSLRLNIDIIAGSITNGVSSQCLAIFQPNVPPGSATLFTPNIKYYLPLNTRNIYRIRTYITDQNGRTVSFFGEPTTIALHIRPSGTRSD